MSGISEEDLYSTYNNGAVPDGSGARLAGEADLAATDFLCSQVEEASIQMDVNRESLKRKLMFRRTLPELVDQGIYPPLNVPPAFADRQRHLQRAQTGDRLRQKLKERPDRECLVQHHILEDTSPLVDRSLQDKQRLLKRYRLQSDLSGRLASRPGPLELVEKNILLTDPQLKDGLIEGTIPFTKTTEVVDPVRRLLHPDIYQVEDEDYSLGIDESGGSLDFSVLVTTSDDSLPDSICLTPTEGASDQAKLITSTASVPSPPESFSVMSPRIPIGVGSAPSNIPPAPDITPLLQGSKKFQFVNPQFKPSPMFTFGSVVQPVSTQSTLAGATVLPSGSNDLPVSSDSTTSTGVSNKRIAKKPKNKNVTKTKVIKFHEYKGPSNRVSTKSRPEPPREHTSSSAYHVLLEQQQLFLQFQLQLEYQQQSLLSRQQSESGPSATTSAIAAPATAQLAHGVTTSTDTTQALSTATSSVFSFKPSHMPVASAVTKPSTRLEDMKVADLRAECRRLNLASHGPKPQLIDRLTPHISKISGQGRESAGPSVRTSDSSLSGSSEVTSPVSGSVDASLSNSQFGLLGSHNSVVPMAIDVANTRPPSIVPMEVDHTSSQNAGSFICATPTAFILLQAAPQPKPLAQAPEAPCQSTKHDVMTLKDQSRQQIIAMAQPSLSNFSSANVGISSAQPLMLVTRPMITAGLPQGKPGEQRASFSASPAPQSGQTVHLSRPNSGCLSSEEIVIRQQHLIASLEQSLQQYQQELIRTQQNARLRELQLSQATVAQRTTADERKNCSLAPLATSNGVGNQAMFRVATSQGNVLVPYKFALNNNGAVASMAGTMPPYKPLLRSATIPMMPISSSLSSNTSSTTTDGYLNSSLISSSSTAPPLFFQQQDNNTIEDVMELLIKQGELSKDDCFASKDSCLSGVSNSSDLDNKPMFFLPEPSSSDGMKFQSGLHSQPGTGMFASAGYRMDSDVFGSSIKLGGPASSTPSVAFSDVQKTVQSIVSPEATFANGDADLSGGLFALTNMEWSDLELDFMNSHMDTSSFKEQPLVGSSVGFVDSRLPNSMDSHFNDIGLDGHHLPLDDPTKTLQNFDLDINTEDWLNINNGSAPIFSLTGPPSSGTAQFANEEYLMMPRPSDTLDLFNIDESDLYMTPDLSTMMAFEKLVEAQTSKT